MATLHDRGPSPKRIARVHRTAADRRVVRARRPTRGGARGHPAPGSPDRVAMVRRAMNRAALGDDRRHAYDARPVPASISSRARYEIRPAIR